MYIPQALLYIFILINRYMSISRNRYFVIYFILLIYVTSRYHNVINYSRRIKVDVSDNRINYDEEYV